MDIDLEKYNHEAFIVGGGNSLESFDWSLLDDKFVVAINTAYTKLPEAQILYFTDPPWASQHMEGLKKFKGLIYQGVLTLNSPPKLPVVHKQFHLTGPTGLETKEGCLKHGSNSVYAAIGLLSVHLKFRRINLLGVDQKWKVRGDKSTSHWHNNSNNTHKRIDGEIVYRKMLDAYKTIKQPLLDLGVEIININTESGTNLKEFPIKSVKEVFGL